MKPSLKPEALGIVIPVYRSTESVKQLLSQIKSTLKDFCTYHIYLVDDSNDSAVSSYLKQFCTGKEITIITLSQNYGQQNAVLCGLHFACKHPVILTMDDDLQHPVSQIPLLYQKLLEGFDLVYAIPESQKTTPFRHLGSFLRDSLFSTFFFHGSKTKVSSFRIMTSDIAKNCASFQGNFFYFSAEALKKRANAAFPKTANLFYQKPKREYGKSGYTFQKLVILFGKLFLYYTPLSIITNLLIKEKTSLYEVKETTPKLMVLGGSNCQLHALQRAKERSISTILVDYTKNPPAKAMADIHEPISTFDALSCIETGKKHQIDGVMTIGTDQPVLTAALTAANLSLPSFLSVDQARSVTNKQIMKQLLVSSNIKTSRFLFLSKEGNFYDENGNPAAFSLRPPYVIKPLDSQGQRGIFKVNTMEELLLHLPETLSYSRESFALVEEFYESDEITVSGWLTDNQLTILTITDRLLYPDATHIGVCIGHRFPSVHISHYEEIKAICDQLTNAFKLENGPFYLQLLLGKDGIYVNELACRIGGAFEDVIIPYLTGFSILDAVIDGALGYPVSFPLSQDFRCDRLDKAAFVLLLFCQPGIIDSVTPLEELLSLPYVADCGYNYSVGEEIPSMENATARFGHAVLLGTKQSLTKDIKDFYNRLQVLDKEGHNLVQIFEQIDI